MRQPFYEIEPRMEQANNQDRACYCRSDTRGQPQGVACNRGDRIVALASRSPRKAALRGAQDNRRELPQKP